jgi:hypothetical protein
LLFLYNRWPVPGWCSVLLLVGHFTFWYWLFWANFFSWRDAPAIYVGPIGPIVGFFSSLAWGLYVAQLAKTPQPPKPVPAE